VEKSGVENVVKKIKTFMEHFKLTKCEQLKHLFHCLLKKLKAYKNVAPMFDTRKLNPHLARKKPGGL